MGTGGTGATDLSQEMVVLAFLCHEVFKSGRLVKVNAGDGGEVESNAGGVTGNKVSSVRPTSREVEMNRDPEVKGRPALCILLSCGVINSNVRFCPFAGEDLVALSYQTKFPLPVN